MREIKFKGFSRVYGRWLYHGVGVFKDKWGTTWLVIRDSPKHLNSASTFEVVEESVGQYIGIKDCNGEEVYEGDIVEHDGGIHPVGYDADSYSFQMHLSAYVLDQEMGEPKKLEVIGNIYENPELLEDCL